MTHSITQTVNGFGRSVCAVMLILGGHLMAVPYAPGTDDYPQRLRREESFFGIHFDFHAGENDKEIGKDVTPEMVNAIIDKVKPDFIQIDCKGHPGCSSYPTKVGYQAGGIVKDQLRIWREATAKRGVSLYMHYSGVFDVKAMSEHPDWAVVSPEGQAEKESWSGLDRQKASVFGPYVDQLLIPQLKELRNEYGVDGYWIDGECWATVPDYNPKVIEQFTQKTGITEIPDGPDKPHWFEWAQFHREGFRNYVRHYTDVLHRDCPGVQVASNWAFSSMMPEPVTIDLDFLSGDYTMQDSVRDARWQARCLQHQGKPWDLMAWGFSCEWKNIEWRSTKTAEQLNREAAIVLAAGGGFQCYYTQRRDASVNLWQMDVLAETARFCRARQAYCHRSESVPQIALFHSTEAVYRKMHSLFGGGGHQKPIRGILDALLDGQHHVDVVAEHQLKGRCNQYPVIVFPEWDYVDPEMYRELIDYVRNGGNLLVIGAAAAELFKEPLGLTDLKRHSDTIRYLHHDGAGAGLKTHLMTATLPTDVKTKGLLITEDHPPMGGTPAGSIHSIGKGKIAAVYADMGILYYNNTTTVMRDFISAMVRELLPDPVVEVRGSHLVDVVVNRKELDGQKRLAVNLINMAGPHRDVKVYTFDDIPAVGPLTIRIRTEQKPQRIVRQPGDESLRFEWANGVTELVLSRLAIYDILVVY